MDECVENYDRWASDVTERCRNDHQALVLMCRNICVTEIQTVLSFDLFSSLYSVFMGFKLLIHFWGFFENLHYALKVEIQKVFLKH